MCQICSNELCCMSTDLHTDGGSGGKIKETVRSAGVQLAWRP